MDVVVRGRSRAGVFTAGLVVALLGIVGGIAADARAQDAAEPSKAEVGKAEAAKAGPGKEAGNDGAEAAKEAAEATKDAADAAKEAVEPLNKVAGDMHMEVLARDLRLTETNADRLKRIAARYWKATRKRLVITGGTRSPAKQAQLVFDKLKRGDDIIKLYENKAAAAELRNAYRDAVAKNLGRKGTIKAMREVIDAQITRGVYVSKHLKSGAVDVRSWDMEGELEKALKDAVKQEPGVSLMDERNGPEPHFHLNLK